MKKNNFPYHPVVSFSPITGLFALMLILLITATQIVQIIDSFSNQKSELHGYSAAEEVVDTNETKTLLLYFTNWIDTALSSIDGEDSYYLQKPFNNFKPEIPIPPPRKS